MSPGWGAQSCGGRGRGHFPPFPAAAFRRQALRPVPCPSPPTNLLPDPTSLPWLPAPGCCCRWLPPAARPQRGRRAQRVVVGLAAVGAFFRRPASHRVAVPTAVQLLAIRNPDLSGEHTTWARDVKDR